MPSCAESIFLWLQNSAGENTSKRKMKTTFDDEIDMKYRLFKQFDVVQDHSDHYYKFSKIKVVNK